MKPGRGVEAPGGDSLPRSRSTGFPRGPSLGSGGDQRLEDNPTAGTARNGRPAVRSAGGSRCGDRGDPSGGARVAGRRSLVGADVQVVVGGRGHAGGDRGDAVGVQRRMRATGRSTTRAPPSRDWQLRGGARGEDEPDIRGAEPLNATARPRRVDEGLGAVRAPSARSTSSSPAGRVLPIAAAPTMNAFATRPRAQRTRSWVAGRGPRLGAGRGP